jgi:hypothetical protein
VKELLIWFFLVTLFCLFPTMCLAEYSFELIPRISISRTYDDNIYLRSTNEVSDSLTAASLGINMMITSPKESLSIDYAPTWVWYDKYDEYNTVRHAGTLAFAQDLTRQLRFDLTDTYLKSEEALEETEEVERIRRTRYTYQRNTGSASLRYQFGTESSLTLGYRHDLLENEDPSIDDGTIQTPFCSMTHWLNIKNGLELDYSLTNADFYRDGAKAEDDYTGHATGIRYMHRFTPHTTGSIQYRLTTRNFEGYTEDYDVHESALGLDHSFSPDLSLSLLGGIFLQDNERSKNQTGYTYSASLVKRFERGSFTIGGRGGWDEAYLEAERTGFTTYWSANSRIEYQLMQRLNFYAGASLRRDRNIENREWETLWGNCGLRLEFLRRFSLSLDYSHAERDDDIDTEDYRDNRLMLLFTARKPYRL